MAGIDVLRGGGSAIDAAIAMSAVLVVVQPYACHLGGDAFTVIRIAGGETLALNAGGRAPLAATPDRFADGIPARGAAAATVPGLVDAWCAVHGRLASKPLPALLSPAIALARDGFAVSPHLAFAIRSAQDLLSADPGCTAAFLSNGAPRSGTTLRQPDLARTLERIATDGGEGFYGHETGDALFSFMRENGGLIGEDDLARDEAAWGSPLQISYRDATVYEQPLPSQGFLTLEALNIVEELRLGQHSIVSADAVHLAAEAMRLAFADRDRYAGDPDALDVPIARLLSKEHAGRLRSTITSKSSAAPAAVHGGDTTSFAVVDGAGNVVTFIQSIFAVWGAAAMAPGTGVLLNNRMTGFSLDPRSPNVVRPGIRTVHTLNTWLVERGDGRVYAGGTPGAHYQVQTNLQVITAMLDWRLNPQSAIDAPQWAWTADGNLALEGRFPQNTFRELEAHGHQMQRLAAWDTSLSRSQIVGLDPRTGSVFAASDPRSEGCALAF